MTRILNLGSCCIDHVYQVPHFVAPGETLPSSNYAVHPGGKGLNQSIALAAAGASVSQAGKVGKDGQWLVDLLIDRGVDTALMASAAGASGHAIIQVSPQGENAIVLHGGTNREITQQDADTAISSCQPGEIMLLQNEISELHYIIERGAAAGLRIVFNAAPMTDSVLSLPLEHIELLIINEIEGKALSEKSEPQEIIDTLLDRYSDMKIVLTLGGDGAWYADASKIVRQSATIVEAIDTTGAGDTFTGFFLAAYSRGDEIQSCLEQAVKAAGICVTRPGAASSIPLLSEL